MRNNNQLPKVAICLAAYNGINFIGDQINSLLLQRDVCHDIYISIDQSTDNTIGFINEWAAIEPKLKILPCGMRFGSAASNFFRILTDIDLNEFDYICFSDQDDIWSEEKLKTAIEVIAKKNVAAYSSNVTAFWPNGRQKLINKSQRQNEWDYMFESAGPGCTYVLTKDLALDLQVLLQTKRSSIKGIHLHDWFIYAFARSRNYKWFIDHRSHVKYRQHSHNVIGANVGFKANIDRWKKLRSGWLIEQAILIADALDYSDSLPIKRLRCYGFFDRLFLILIIHKLRRRIRDRVALAIFFIIS